MYENSTSNSSKKNLIIKIDRGGGECITTQVKFYVVFKAY